MERRVHSSTQGCDGLKQSGRTIKPSVKIIIANQSESLLSEVECDI